MENQENKKTVSFKETPEIINESIIRNTPIIDNHTETNKKRRKENKETEKVNEIVETKTDQENTQTEIKDTFNFLSSINIFPSTQTILFIFVIIICFFIFIMNNKKSLEKEEI